MLKEVSGFHSPFFKLYDVIKTCVYAAIVNPGAGGLGNAGFIDLGEHVLVVDTFLSPRVAEDLNKAIEFTIGKPVKYVVNTHYHADHTNGNQVFQDAIIISTKRTRELMIENNQVGDVQEEKQQLLDYLHKTEEEAAGVTDEKVKQSMLDDVNDKKVFAEELPIYRFTPPSITFEDRLKIHGTKRCVEILTYGGGHTESDAFVYLKDENLAFMADLVLVNSTPFMGVGKPDHWPSILDKVKQLNLNTIIPGHGQVGSAEHIDLTDQFINFVLDTIRIAKEKGLTADEAVKTDVPEPFNSWDGVMILSWNIQMLWDKVN
jgi:cyclase